MSISIHTNASLRKMISVLLLIGLLSLLLVLYFLKYVPDQRNDFHRQAFLELGQIQKALQTQNAGFLDAIKSTVESTASGDIPGSLLTKYFKFNKLQKSKDSIKQSERFTCRGIAFDQSNSSGNWTLEYLLGKQNSTDTLASLSKNVDSLVKPIVATYKDIFSDYLLILDTSSNLIPEKPERQNVFNHKGRVIFNSGRLSVDFLVDLDTLLKKTDGFSLLNIHDVKIEGNPYKLFLYPIQMGRLQVVLGGLISQSRYKEGSEAVPLDLITIGSLLALLLLLNLPLLKIYIIGPMERITAFDIRMIIVTYFLAAFMTFFLLAAYFLSHVQTESAHTGVSRLAKNIDSAYQNEIRLVHQQLEEYDFKYDSILNSPHASGNDTSYLGFSYAADAKKIKTRTEPDVGFKLLDSAFSPTAYRAMDNVFWVDTAGNWLARWGRKKLFRLSHPIQVADRQYFRDIMNNDTLSIDSGGYTIQPTLSKLTGEYNVNVAIKSRFYRSPTAGKIVYPGMLGITADMYSIQNTILPTGYTFSIVDDKGLILFDARPGRGLLSNIFVEAGDNTELQQCVRYRYEHFFKQFTLRGREVALLSTPMTNTKYTLLVYYNLWVMQEVHFHSLGLSCFCVACILSLIAFVAFLNEWSKKKPSLLRLSPVNFDWLRPFPSKFGYYRHLIAWLRIFLILFLLSWGFIELLLPDCEPALLLISMCFPVFMAIHYFILRDKYYHMADGKEIILPAHPWVPDFSCILPFMKPAALKPLGIALLVMIIYVFTAGLGPGIVIATLVIMLLFLVAIILSCQRFRRRETTSDMKELLDKYIWAILTGVFTITLAPAIALFMLFYKEEHNGIVRMGMLSMMQKMDDRARAIDDKKKDTYLNDHNPQFIQDSKFKNGIYFTDRSADTPALISAPAEKNFTAYASLHNLLFQADSTSLEALARLSAAGDNSWRFGQASHPQRLILNHCNPVGHCRNAFSLSADPVSLYPALRFFLYRIFSLGAMRLSLLLMAILVTMIAATRLTASLASHVFLIRLLENFRKKNDPQPPSDPWRPSDLGARPTSTRHREAEENEILETQIWREKFYDNIWKQLSTEEKYVLYDFALDGFTNYKAGVLLYNLLYRDLLYIDKNYQIRIRSADFHNYLLSKDIFNQYLQNEEDMNKDDVKVYRFMLSVRKQGFWQAFRVPLQVIIGAAGLFIFFTQEALTQKILGLFTSLPFITQMLASFFERSNGQKGKADSGKNTDL